MADWAAKRFWEKANIVEASDGFAIHLDDKPLKTPAKAPLLTPTLSLAQHIASEWDAQIEKIDPTSMPTTRGANAAIDKVSIQRAEIIDMLCEYGDSDLLCYRATQPTELIERQARLWDPLLEWADQNLDAKLEPRSGIIHYAQSDTALKNLRAPLVDMSDFQIAAFHDLVGLSGSLVLALAVTHKHIEPETAWELSQLDENYQIETWGEDDEALQATAIKRESFLHAAWFYHAA